MENPQRLVEEELPRQPYKGERLGLMVGLLLGESKFKGNEFVLESVNKTRKYFEWKCSLVSSYGAERGKLTYIDPSSLYSCSFKDKSHEWFKKMFIRNGKAFISPQLIRHLNRYGLAVWFMDSGDSFANKKAVLRTKGFTYGENVLIQKMLKHHFELSADIVKDDNDHLYLSFDPKATRILKSLISPFIHPTMRYKVR